jgi:hypothetical protein
MCRRLLSSFVVFALLLGSVVVLAPGSPVLAQFESLRWSPIRTPSDEEFVVVNPSEVSALVFGSPTVWYAADTPNEKLYRTMDGGLSWEDEILDNLMDATPAPTLPVWDLAVAPDDPAFVVAVTDDRQAVYLSEDGGDTWDHLNIGATGGWDPTILIADIAVSPLYNGDGQRDVAVGTRLPDGATDGDVWIIRIGVIGTWNSQELDMDVSCVAFSPNYSQDETILALAHDTDGTYLVTGYRTVASNTTLWQVTDPNLIEVSMADEDSPIESEMIYSDMALPGFYDGDDASARQVYVSYASMAETDDVYRIDDWRVQRLDLKQGVKIPVYTISYYDERLIVGEVAADGATGRARIHLCDDPTSLYPPDWYEPEKRPSGGFGSGVANAIVRFSPGGFWAVCGTSTNSVITPADWADMTLPGGPWDGNAVGDPDESAVSRAEVHGVYDSWNQISLIDTDIAELCDYSLWLVGSADNPPGNIIYLASTGAGADSIWRTTALEEEDLGLRWERVDYLDSLTDELILRRTPESDSNDAIFYAVRGDDLLYKSTDDGRLWSRIHECPEDLTDFAVVNSERLYVLSDYLLAIGQVTKIREWRVWRWTYEIDTGLKSGNTLRYHGSSHIFVGDNGDEGEIAVSTDGGETFALLPALPEIGAVHVELDEDFARNKCIYAATEDSSSGIYRWTLGGATAWFPMRPPDLGFTGLAQTKSVLYGAFGEGVDRTLIPRAPTMTVMDWDRLTVGLTAGTDFRPDTLRTSVNDVVNIWAIDNRSYDYEGKVGRLWVYADTFVLPTPWPVTPALGEVLPCDICDCEACPFCFEWKPMPKAVQWDLWVALDEGFQYVVLKLEDIEPWCCDTPGVCYFEIPFDFDCNGTYYWRVRATGTTEGERVHSRWSPSMHFLVAAGSTVEHMHVAPLIVTPDMGATVANRTPGFAWTGFGPTALYEFQLSADNSFARLLARQDLERTAYVYPGELEWGKTYFWRVRALTPHPSEWANATFTVLTEPTPQAVSPPATLGTPLGAMGSLSGTPMWVWLVIAVLFLLAVCLITFIAVDRRK